MGLSSYLLYVLTLMPSRSAISFLVFPASWRRRLIDSWFIRLSWMQWSDWCRPVFWLCSRSHCTTCRKLRFLAFSNKEKRLGNKGNTPNNIHVQITAYI